LKPLDKSQSGIKKIVRGETSGFVNHNILCIFKTPRGDRDFRRSSKALTSVAFYFAVTARLTIGPYLFAASPQKAYFSNDFLKSK
jgi:hypothetical protein